MNKKNKIEKIYYYQVSSGRGPEECELAVGRFMGYLIREKFVKNNDVIFSLPGEMDYTYKSIYFKSDKDLSEFIGTNLWICESPFRKNHGRKNWFFCLNRFENTEIIDQFNESEVTFKSTHSRGPGGQNVNKVETAVIATYKPYNITVKSETGRSQFENKKIAIERIKLILLQKTQKILHQEKFERWMQHNKLERGNPKATFTTLKFKRK